MFTNPFQTMAYTFNVLLENKLTNLLIKIIAASFSLLVLFCFLIGLTSGELWLVKFGLWILTSTFKVLVLTFVLYIISWYVLRSPKIVNSKAFQKTKDWFLVTFDVNNTINMIKEKTESKLKKIQSDGEFVEKTSKAKTVKLVDLFSVLKKEKEKKIDL